MKFWLRGDIGYVESQEPDEVDLVYEHQEAVAVAGSSAELLDLIEQLEAAGRELWGADWRKP